MRSNRSGVNRRQFFTRSALAAGATTLGGGFFDALVARAAYAGPGVRAGGAGYGPLRPAGDDLALPAGFQYRVLTNEGDTMSDGFPTPKAMDGMAAFPLPNGNVLLIRNHEDSQAASTLRPRPAGSTSSSAGILNGVLDTDFGPREFAYDAYAGGGTTSIEVEPFGHRRVVSDHWSLVGTFRNCAGGMTAWGSWLSCEETLESASATGLAEDHGYIFEVPIGTSAGYPVMPVALKHMGRFAHEAVAVDPSTGIVYETEDQGDVSGFYRFVPATRPTKPGDYASTSGLLEIMKVVGQPQYETAINQQLGVPLRVEWVPITNPDPSPASATVAGVAGSAVFAEGYAKGGIRFRRLEGCWFANGMVYFISTNGGNMGFGQVFAYNIALETLTLIAESSGHDVFDGPDNVCVSPRGGLIMCEDAGGPQYLRGISPTGEVFDFARNLRNTIEFAGACFSPDGQTLFVNLFGRSSVRTTQPFRSPVQIPVGPEKFERAATVAIWGPWGAGPL
ncbi:MAG TPA: alkaline phosphatase PhoX [Vicinamibacterales bacterium]|nr:alkaline phosphatase PhoX [Vicinamibacterales bacterium]